MEQHLADLQRAQRKKRAMGDNRALEKGALMMPQADQELPNKVEGTLAGTSISGGAMGLDRVVGAGGRKGRKGGAHAGAGVSGAGVVSDLHIPIISDVARLFGLGKKGKRQGRKAREDEKLGMEVKGLKNKMEGGSYIDPMFGTINQPQGSSVDLLQVAGEAPMGSGYSGAGMAKAQGQKMAEYLKELHGEGYAKEFAGGFWGALASLAAPLIGKLISGNGKKKGKKAEKWIQEATEGMKEGAFTDQAIRAGMTPMEYAKDVLAHPKKHTLKTRRRAQFVKNVTGGIKGRHSGAEYSDDELEMIMEAPEEYEVRTRHGAPVRGVARAPLMPGPAMAAQRLGGPLPAAAGQSAVEAAAAAAGIAPARVASPPAAQTKKRRASASPPPAPGQKKIEKEKKHRGGAKPGDRRVARAAVVKKVMAEKGLSMIEASKYVKQNGLY